LDIDITDDDDTDGDANIEITHDGGDTIDTEALRIIVEDEDDNQLEATDQFDERFGVGDSESGTFDVTGEGTADATENINVRIIHVESESIIADRTIEVAEIDGIGATSGDELTFP
jgi:hypothetical protein